MRRLGTIGKRSNTNIPTNPQEVKEPEKEIKEPEKVSKSTSNEDFKPNESEEKLETKNTSNNEDTISKEIVLEFIEQLRPVFKNLLLIIMRDLGTSSSAYTVCNNIIEGMSNFETNLKE